MDIPELIRVRQRFEASFIKNIEAEIRRELGSLKISLKPGSRIAITAGSRGIDNIAAVLKAVAAFVREAGGQPFFVPAMGSHGSATAEGQLKLLEGLGIKPEVVGAPIHSSMDTVEAGVIDTGFLSCDFIPSVLPVHMDKLAYEADGVIVVNRVKPHTSFHGEVESGLQKMIAIGLGKAVQATNVHSFGTSGLKQLIAPIAKMILETGKIIAGIGLVENAYDRIMSVRAFLPEGIEQGERELLTMARKNMPSLPIDKFDLLIIEQMGKNISGTGMDTNIIGRLRIEGEPEPESPSIKRVAVLDLSDASNGNAYGMGLADFTTRSLVDKIDYKATYANALATNFIERIRIPYIAVNEKEAVEIALKTCSLPDIAKAEIIKIKDTLHLEQIEVSPSIYQEIKNKVDIIA